MSYKWMSSELWDLFTTLMHQNFADRVVVTSSGYVKSITSNSSGIITVTKGNNAQDTIAGGGGIAAVMIGATTSSAGVVGAVPAPAAGDNLKFLRGDGQWVYMDNDSAEAWAISANSPDDTADTNSPTGKTQSSRTWALTAESFAEQTANLVDAQTADAAATYSYPDVIVWSDGYNYRCVGTNVNVNDDVPGISQKWVCLSRVTDAAWEVDTNGGLMPVINPIGDSNWELDLAGALMPTVASE